MFCSRIRILFSVLTVSVLAVAALAQSSENAPAASSTAQTSDPSTSTMPSNRRSRRAQHSLCWREAGITPDKVNEQWKIQDAGKVKIKGVCSDSALTAQQRLDKIHEINAETDKEIEKLVPPKQLSAYKACKAQHEGDAKARGPLPKELGPCGGIIPPEAKGQDSMQSHDHSTMDHPNN